MKKNMLACLLLSLLTVCTTSAQKDEAILKKDVLKREIGIRTPGLSNFDFIYKKPRGENRFKRLRVIYTNVNYRLKDYYWSYAFGLAYGWEKRKPLKDKFSLIGGWEIIGSVNGFIQDDEVNWFFTPELGLVLGIQYDLTENFVVNLETIPKLGSTIGHIGNDKVKVSTLHLNIDTRDIALGFLYRF